MNSDELRQRLIFLEARELELDKERQANHDELMVTVGTIRGRDAARAEYEKEFDIPLSPEIREKIRSIIRDVKAKATTEVPK